MSIQNTLFSDIDRVPTDVTRSRHRGSAESIAANPSADSKRETYRKIIDLLKVRPMTGKEMEGPLGKAFNTYSGRLSELKAMGRIRKTGVRRDGAELELAI